MCTSFEERDRTFNRLGARTAIRHQQQLVPIQLSSRKLGLQPKRVVKQSQRVFQQCRHLHRNGCYLLQVTL
jgi:hypothetical protein